MKHIDNDFVFFFCFCLYVEYQESKKIFSVVILLLLHPMFLVKFFLEILCVILKSICYFYLVILLQIISISVIRFLANMSFLGKLLLCLVDHL